jgi:erythritol kinase
MKRDILIGIDAGTSVIKSIAFDIAGTQIGSFALPNLYTAVEGVGAEQDMARTWTDTAATLRGLATLVPDLERRCIAIAVTGQGDGTWLIDEEGRPTGPALLWLDARSAPIAEAIRATPRGRRIFEATGTGVNACQQGVQLLWLKQHRPERLARAATAFHCKDWLYFNLTGTRAADPSESVLTFGNFRSLGYAPEVIDALGLGAEARLLPPIVDGMREIGRLSEQAARETGFPDGVPVVLAYIDIVATALGAGLFDERGSTGCTIIGSTGMHMRLARSVEDVALNSGGTGYTIAFPVPGTYAQLQSNMASTLNIDWLIDLARGILSEYGISKTRGDLLADLDARVLAAAPANLLFHPYISEAGERGPFVDAAARAQFHGLSLRHNFNDLTRAVYEGLAFAARDCYAAMGPVPREIRVTGGAARSKALRTIFGAALATDIRTSSREEAGAAGAAMMAAVATGLYPDMPACTERWVAPLLGPALEPDPALVKCYEKLFPTYVAAREASVPIWQALREQRAVARHG